MQSSKEKKSTTVLDQPDISAFISLYQQTQPRPFLRESDQRVCFEFDVDISPSIQAFYQNVQVPIADYIKTLKHIRSAIFSLKRSAGNAK